MKTELPSQMRLHLEDESRRTKLLKLASAGGDTVPSLVSKLTAAALDALPDDHITFPLRFQVLSPKKALAA